MRDDPATRQGPGKVAGTRLQASDYGLQAGGRAHFLKPEARSPKPAEDLVRALGDPHGALTCAYRGGQLGDMRKANALELRRSLGRVLRALDRDGRPILIEKGREPKAVLISLRDYRERFVDAMAADERERLAADILALRARARRSRIGSVELVRGLRGPLP